MACRNVDVSVLLILLHIATASSIHTYLSRHEPVHYDRHDLHQRHILYDHSRQLKFHIETNERMYHLRLRRTTSPLTTNFTLYHNNRKLQPNLSHIYHGHVEGIQGSEVHGAVLDGHFKGSIDIPGQDTLYIEPNSNKADVHHSIIYTHRDLKGVELESFCGNSWLNMAGRDGDQQTDTNVILQRNMSRRRRVSTTGGTNDSLTKHICTLRLTADHRMWDFMYTKNDKNPDRTLNEILFMAESHVRELNDIFGNTMFTTKINDQQITFRGIQFEIRQVQIIKPEDCLDKNSSFSEAGICMDGLSSEILLAQYSKLFQGPDPFYDYASEYGEYEYPAYPDYYIPDYYMAGSTEKERICLNYLLTARVLFASNGNAILGQAYNAQVDKSGGICFPRDNVGMITILQNTDLHNLPHLVTMNVFAHEVGHSFGAKHDDGKDCAPYLAFSDEPDDGFYLMHSVASPIRKKNNRIFSNCSNEFVARILTDEHYVQCFEDSNVPFCGNNVIELGEECDCGTNVTCVDKCCYAQGEITDRPDLDCRLKATASCSPTQGPCCDGNTCKFIQRSENFVCENAQPCMDELYCDGRNWRAKCPPPKRSQMREDGFICNRNGRVCEHGQCNRSMCNLIGWRECQAYSDRNKLTREEREELCYIGCRKSSKSECISTNNHDAIQANPDMMRLLTNLSNGQIQYAIRLPMGTPCNKMTGYCDVFYRCRGVDPDTPLVRLKNCVTSGKCLAIFKEFLQVYWWAVLLCAIGFITVFVTFLYCCTVHTKSNNPEIERRHPHRSFRDDIRTMSTIQRSLRRRVSTIRRSLSTRSSNVDPRDRDISVLNKTEKGGLSDMHELQPLRECTEGNIEIDIHAGSDVEAKTYDLKESESLKTDAQENG